LFSVFPSMNFTERLKEISKENDSLLCVGLDSDLSKLPESVKGEADPVFEFNRRIVDATKDLVCAYKPNIAFYEQNGPKGLVSLKSTMEYIKQEAPRVIVIIDAKRGDIGNTAKAYARALVDDLGADCVTLSPYLGWDSLGPFLEEEEVGAFVLCKTSNRSGGELQDVMVEAGGGGKMKLYQYVARTAVGWNVKKNIGLVVGATYPEELKDVRELVGNDMPLLIPGIGAQGGDLEKSVKFGCSTDGFAVVINSSRGIIFKDPGPEFAKFSREAAQDLRGAINQHR